ncbi:MAG TPA: hypothetical protein ENH38_09115 [Nitrospirae bacterium]|nr:hypothetical protein [Nitrospirota bacterium]
MKRPYFSPAKKLVLLIVIFSCIFLIWRFVRPMNIFVVDERFARPIKIEIPRGLGAVSALECRKCHEEEYREWSGSMHAKAWTDPYFQVDSAYDGSQQICMNCHIPLENQQKNLVLGFRDKEKFNPILKPNPDYDPSLQNEGVTCAVCHIRDGKIVGPFKTGNAPHAVEYDPEYFSGVNPCMRCHVVSGKRWDTFYRVPPCGTVAEIREGDEEPDCIGCHMPVRDGGPRGARRGRMHTFRGGHHPSMVKSALKVEYKKETGGSNDITFTFTLTNTGAYHYLPTGTPDRYLTLEFRLLNTDGKVVKQETYTMKRYILWRPFIIDLKDTRLPYNRPVSYFFSFRKEKTQAFLEVTVRYHLLDEKRRKRIGYKNTEPVAYPVYNMKIPL